LSVWKRGQFKQMNDCLVRLDSDVAFGWLSDKFAHRLHVLGTGETRLSSEVDNSSK